MTKKMPAKALEVSPRNTGFADIDKGHIFALELGGPDLPMNICGQFSQLQRNGEWRRMEVAALELAEEMSPKLIFMSIGIVYGNTSSAKRSRVPLGFLIELSDTGQSGSLLKSFKILNTQDLTDDKMLYRRDVDAGDEKEVQVVYGPYSSPTSFDRPVLGVQIAGRSEILAPLSRRASLTPGIQLLSTPEDVEMKE
jgi:hypothetical protein